MYKTHAESTQEKFGYRRSDPDPVQDKIVHFATLIKKRNLISPP